jgi:hypothetical protein
MAIILHRIKALLFPNRLTENADDFYAKVISERTLDIADICESAVARGNAPTSAETMKINVELFLKEMGYQLKDGYSVNTGYFTATPQIKGVFKHISDKFDKMRHSVYFLFHQGEILRRNLDDIEVEIHGADEMAGAMIAEVTDVKTGSVNDRITPNRNLRIRGAKLKLAGTNPNVGVYFVDGTTGEEIKVEASDIVSNKPSELVIIIPQLAAGFYTLKVTTQYSKSRFTLNEPRNILFDKILTVT